MNMATAIVIQAAASAINLLACFMSNLPATAEVRVGRIGWIAGAEATNR
jgi:hypothetical protein